MWRWANPWALALLALPALVLLWAVLARRAKAGGLPLPTVPLLVAAGLGRGQGRRVAQAALRALALAALVLALARPQSGTEQSKELVKSADIMLVLDVSSSMLAEDFYPRNRMQAAKEVIADFIAHQKDNRLGLVVFAGRSFTHAPLTTDYAIIRELLKEIDTSSVQADGTAIGDGLANAVYRLKDATRKSRVVVLLTDGENNSGRVTPFDAAHIAAAKGIKVYAIGMGRLGRTVVPFTDPVTGEHRMIPDNGVDERTLKELARITRGRYWLASSTGALKEVYDEIGRLEKSEIEIRRATYYAEWAALPLAVALALLALEFGLAHTRWRVVGA